MQILELKKHIVLTDAAGAAVTFLALVVLYRSFRRLFVMYGKQESWERLLTGVLLIVSGYAIDFLDQTFKLPDVIQHFAENMLMLAGAAFIFVSARPVARSLMLAGELRELSGAPLPPAEGAREPRAVRLVKVTPEAVDEVPAGLPPSPPDVAETLIEPEPISSEAISREIPAQDAIAETRPQVIEGRSRGSYIVGNKVGRTLIAMDGHTIAVEGDVITSEILDDAKASGRIADLIVDMIVRDRFEEV